MNKENIIVAGIVAVVVSVLGFLVAPSKTEVVRDVVTESPEYPQYVGAVASPDIPSPYLSWGSGPIWRGTASWASGSTTVCSFRAPSDGKLLSITAGPSVATTSLDLVLATSTVQTGTTTIFSHKSIGGSVGTYFTWNPSVSTTSVENTLNGMIKKDIWVNLGVTGPGVSSVNGVGAAGTCSYIFEQVN